MKNNFNAMFNMLNELSLLNGVSGDENDVRDYILQKITAADISGVEINTDNLGNLHVIKKGAGKPKNKVMLAAHMDEVGFIATAINDDGFIKISAVGGISDNVCMGRKIRFKSGAIGVIGGCPVHLLTSEQSGEQPKLKDLLVDIGAVSREDAEKHVKLGDSAYFISEYFEFGGENIKIKGKALDDRIGCAVMLDIILNTKLKYDICFVFTSMEEIGTRGAGVAAYIEKPDFALILEATTACDIAGVSGEKKVCSLGMGTVITHMDLGAVYDRELYKLAFDTAAENNLKCQTKTMIAGGNDSGIIHKSAGGIRTLALSAPCRYIHSPSCVADKNDICEMRILTEKILEKISVL